MAPAERRISYFITTDRDQRAAPATSATDGSGPETSDPQVRDVFGAVLLHRTHDLWVASEDPDRSTQGSIRRRLLAQRFSVDDAEEWAYRNWNLWLDSPSDLASDLHNLWICDHVTTVAVAYRDTGMPIDEAFAWIIRSVDARNAVQIRGRGWNPDTYSTLIGLCRNSTTSEDESHWGKASIVWWRALRYLQVGFSLPEALEQERRRLAGEDIDAALDVLLGLTGQGSV